MSVLIFPLFVLYSPYTGALIYTYLVSCMTQLCTMLVRLLYLPPKTYCLNLSNSLKTTMFASKKRSTHCLMQGSSYLSSFPFLIVPAGMHLRKHVSVKLWMAVIVSATVLMTLADRPNDPPCMEEKLHNVHDWMRAFCPSLMANCCSCCLSASLRRETSTFARPPPSPSILIMCEVAWV